MSQTHPLDSSALLSPYKSFFCPGGFNRFSDYVFRSDDGLNEIVLFRPVLACFFWGATVWPPNLIRIFSSPQVFSFLLLLLRSSSLAPPTGNRHVSGVAGASTRVPLSPISANGHAFLPIRWPSKTRGRPVDRGCNQFPKTNNRITNGPRRGGPLTTNKELNGR
jgi:hypothetical protein